MNRSEYVTLAQAAAQLGYTKAALKRWQHRGLIAPAIPNPRLNLYRMEDLRQVARKVRERPARGRRQGHRTRVDNNDDRFVSARQIEDLLGVSPNLINQWVYRDRLAPIVKGKRPHLYRLSDVEDILDGALLEERIPTV